MMMKKMIKVLVRVVRDSVRNLHLQKVRALENQRRPHHHHLGEVHQLIE